MCVWRAAPSDGAGVFAARWGAADGPAIAREARGGRGWMGAQVDAPACRADEGRGHAAQRLGERLARYDPRVPEWVNPPRVIPRRPRLNA